MAHEVAMQINVSVDAGDLLKQLQELGGRRMKAAMTASLNKAIDAVYTETHREVRRTYAIKQKDITSVMSKSKSNFETLMSAMTVRAKQVPVHLFGNPKQVTSGTNVTIRKGGGRVKYPGAYIDRKNGGIVLWRQKVGGKRVGRYPTTIILGPAVSQIVSSKPFAAKIRVIAAEKFRVNLKNQIDIRSKAPARFRTKG